MGIGKRGWKSVGALAALVLLPRCDGGVGPEAGEDARQPASAFEEAPPAAPPAEASEPPAAPPARVHTFLPVADGSVDAAQPDRGLGGDEALQVDALPTESRAYTRFAVAGLSGRVARATLRLYAFSGTSDGPAVYRIQGPWTEAGLTFHAQPWRYGAALDDAGPIAAGTWVELDVTAAVTGNGVHELGLFATSADGVDFDSRESRHEDRRPQLVVETDSAPPDACASATREDTRVILPLADEAVHEDTQDVPPGSGPTLRVDASPVRFESFLHFDLEHDKGGPIVSAKLRLFATNGSVDGVEVHHAGGNAWNWGSLTWSRRPQVQRLLADLDEVSANGWVEVDVTALVKGGEEFTFGLLPGGADGVEFRASATGLDGLAPHLLITRAPPGCGFRGTGGAIEWTRQHGGPGYETASAMATAEDGTSFVAAGSFVGGGDFGGAAFSGERGLVVARYSGDGAHQWSRAFPVETWAHVSALSVTSTGHILVVGAYGGALDLGTGPLPYIDEWPTTSGIFVARLSPQGEPLWAHGFRSVVRSNWGGRSRTGVSAAAAVGTDFMGSLIVTGAFTGRMDLGGGMLDSDPAYPLSDEPEPGLFLARFHADGRHLWSIAFPGGHRKASVASALATDSQGFIYVGGRTASPLLGATQPRTPFIAKFSWNGTPQWLRAFDGATGSIHALATLPGGGVGFAGGFRGTFSFGGQAVTTAAPSPDYQPDDLVLGTMRASGHDGWVRTAGGTSQELAYSLGVDAGGGLVVGGWTRAGTLDLGGGVLTGTPPSWDTLQHFVARYGPDGAHRWSRLLGVKNQDPVPLLVTADGRTRLAIPFEGAFDPGSGSATSRGSRDVLFLQLAP
jgi:hypothetical protein